MCGINAIIVADNSQASSAYFEAYRTLVESTRHRGLPDYFNEHSISDNAILGANRLPITSNDKEQQPAYNEQRNIAAILNGEIYNYRELRRDLQARGHSFRGEDDTEVLVHGYEEYGENLLDRIDGMFAFVIWDDRKKDYLMGRDPFGIKPIYYCNNNDTLYVSSEIKGLAQLDIGEIKDLKPGHYLTSNGEKRYFSLKESDVPEDVDTIKSDLRMLIDNAVRKMVDTNLPISVFFSGGIDSAIVLSTALKYHSNVTAITFGLDGSSDRMTAERFCKEYSVPLLIAEPVDIEPITPKLVEIIETFELDYVRHVVGNYTVSKTARENGFKIALVGESSDELFGGYEIFKEVDNSLVNRICRMLVEDLHRTELQRVDRGAMHWTIEARVPFLDVKLVEYALGIPTQYKIRDENGKLVDKWILREAMTDRLPEYITKRIKEHFCAGGGLNVDNPNGIFGRIAAETVTDDELKDYQRKFPEFELRHKEDVMNFRTFHQLGYTKAKFTMNRIKSSREETHKRILK